MTNDKKLCARKLRGIQSTKALPEVALATLGESLAETHIAVGEALIVLYCHEYIRRPAAIRNENGPCSAAFLARLVS